MIKDTLTQPASKQEVFRLWMRDVSRCIELNCGMTAMDLPDAPYWDWYDEGITVKTAAQRAITRAKSF